MLQWSAENLATSQSREFPAPASPGVTGRRRMEEGHLPQFLICDDTGTAILAKK